MQDVIKALQREVKALKVYSAILTFVFLSFVFLAFTTMRDKNEILRARGIIIEDGSGRERILIGAPVPESRNRIRSDFEKAKAAWGTRYPQFDWYKTVSSAANGILILDEKGFDKIAIGDPVPDPNIGKRIAPSVGIAINDNDGFERTGWGVFPDKNRVVLGLDNDRGTEGVILSVLEDGNVGLSINADRNHVYLGSAPAKSFMTELSAPFLGLLVRDSSGVTYKSTSAEH